MKKIVFTSILLFVGLVLITGCQKKEPPITPEVQTPPEQPASLEGFTPPPAGFDTNPVTVIDNVKEASDAAEKSGFGNPLLEDATNIPPPDYYENYLVQ